MSNDKKSKKKTRSSVDLVKTSDRMFLGMYNTTELFFVFVLYDGRTMSETIIFSVNAPRVPNGQVLPLENKNEKSGIALGRAGGLTFRVGFGSCGSIRPKAIKLSCLTSPAKFFENFKVILARKFAKSLETFIVPILILCKSCSFVSIIILNGLAKKTKSTRKHVCRNINVSA